MVWVGVLVWVPQRNRLWDGDFHAESLLRSVKINTCRAVQELGIRQREAPNCEAAAIKASDDPRGSSELPSSFTVVPAWGKGVGVQILCIPHIRHWMRDDPGRGGSRAKGSFRRDSAERHQLLLLPAGGAMNALVLNGKLGGTPQGPLEVGLTPAHILPSARGS